MERSVVRLGEDWSSHREAHLRLSFCRASKAYPDTPHATSYTQQSPRSFELGGLASKSQHMLMRHHLAGLIHMAFANTVENMSRCRADAGSSMHTEGIDWRGFLG